MKLSFVCIGTDELKYIKRLFPELLELGDELVYVDSDSKDGSAEYAESIGCKVLRRPRNMNANINRSIAFNEGVTGDWVFYVDPDEKFSKELIQELREQVQAHPEIRGYKLPRKNYYFGVWLQHGGQYPDNQLRIFKKGYGHFANLHVHERLIVDGPVGTLKTPMEHFPYEDIAQFVRKFDFYSTFEAKFLDLNGQKVDLKNSFKFLFFKPLNRFLRRYFVKQGFRDGIAGYFAALFDAVGWMMRYFKLWEMRRTKLSQNEKPKQVT